MSSLYKRFVILATLLCAFAVLPTTAWAKTVASIGSKNYTSFASAVKAARSGQTIKLKSNATYTGDFKKKVTINLNNKLLKLVKSGASGMSAYVTNKVNIKYGTVVGGFYVGKRGDLYLQSVTIKKGQYSRVQIYTEKAGSKLRLQRCSSSARLCFAICGNGSNAQFEDCSFTNCKIQVNENASAKILDGTYKTKNNVYDSLLGVNATGRLTIKGGKFYCADSYNPCCSNNGHLAVYGGSFTNDKNGKEIFSNYGTMKLWGGTVVSKSTYANNVIVNHSGKFTMDGGKVVSHSTGSWRNCILQDGTDGTLTITGGTIQSDYGRAVSGPKSCISISGGVKLIVPDGVDPVYYY